MNKLFTKTNFFSNTILHCLLNITICLVIYSNTLNSPFVFDDTLVIVENPIVKDLGYMLNPLEAIVHKGHFEYESFKHRYIGYLTFAINYWIHELDVTGYHLINLSIHIINSLIVYWLVILTFRTPFLNFSIKGLTSNEIALYSSIIFACHPVQTQAVTYIWQRVTSLSTTFFVLSLIFYIIWRIKSKNLNQLALKPLLFYIGSFISAVIAMKTKEIAFTLPVIILLYELMFFKDKLKKRIFYMTPLFLTMLIIPLSLLEVDKINTDLIGNISEATRVDTNIPRWDYLLTQFIVIVTYLRLIFFPINQNLDYDFPIYNTIINLNVLLSFLLLISIFVLGIYMFFKSRTHNCIYRVFAFGIFWFFITLSVESSFIPIVDVIFEHRIYLPSVGFFIALSTGIFLLLKQIEQSELHSIGFLIFLAVIVIFSVLTYSRNNDWSSDIKIWQDNVEKSPHKARPHNNLGLALKKHGRTEEAIQHFLLALRIKPDYGEAHNNIGNVLNDKGRTEEAIQHFLHALRTNPDSFKAHNNLGNVLNSQGRTKEAVIHYLQATHIKPNSAEVLNNLGSIFYKQGRIDESINHFLKALSIKSEFEEAHNNLGFALNNQGYVEEAIKHFLEAIRIKPDFEEAHINLGNVFNNQDRTEGAVKHYLEVLRINPDSVEGHNNLGLALSKQGHTEEGIKHYLQALRIKPNFEEAHNNLAVSLILKGHLDKSIFHFRKAIQINPNYILAKQNLEKALKYRKTKK